MNCVAFHNCTGEDPISHDYLTLLDERYNKYLKSVCSNENVDTLENQLLTFVKSIVKEYY